MSSPVYLQSQASSSELGKQLAEVESLLQKQDLLEAQISAHGETISTISSTALKVLSDYCRVFLFYATLCLYSREKL